MRDGIYLFCDLLPRKRGSMEQQLVALAEALRSTGTTLTYVFSGAPARFPARELAELGVEVRWLDLVRPVEAARVLGLWLAARPAQLVHFHFVRAYSPLVASAFLSGAR